LISKKINRISLQQGSKCPNWTKTNINRRAGPETGEQFKSKLLKIDVKKEQF
jgi:hypothetical protein